MTKTELIAKLAEEGGLTKAAAAKVLDCLIGQVTEELKKEGWMALHGLGSFEVVQREERDGRNPQTGEKLTIPASKSVKFKAAKALKDAVN